MSPRHLTFALRAATGGAAVALTLIGCGAKVTVDLGSGGSTVGTSGTGGVGGVTTGNPFTSTTTGNPFTSTTTGTSVVSSSSTSVVSSSSSGMPGCPPTPPISGPCVPTATCSTNASPCLAHVGQSASSNPGFRMSQLTFYKPDVFTKGIVGQTLAGSVMPDDPSCHLTGGGSFSWLLQFKPAAGALITGGSKPSPQPAGPYSFVNAMVQQGGTTLQILPAALMGSLSGCDFNAGKADVIVPVYFDASGMQSVYLPLRGLSMAGSMSSNLDCIGTYNAAALSPNNGCMPDAQTPAFLDGGKLSASMRLEDADTIQVSALNQTLCVLLSGNYMAYGTVSPSGQTVCKRDANGHIVFQGDWCSATDSPANGGCADAMGVSASFAAQAVVIQ